MGSAQCFGSGFDIGGIALAYRCPAGSLYIYDPDDNVVELRHY